MLPTVSAQKPASECASPFPSTGMSLARGAATLWAMEDVPCCRLLVAPEHRPDGAYIIRVNCRLPGRLRAKRMFPMQEPPYHSTRARQPPGGLALHAGCR